ncbi:DegV family protein [Macrococcoides caseolyticum]|uniref:DegV family protein n=1 Tax=Macrococcoides caseolyticum TaxID=69966 RepID=UPI001F249757|nr:DegV family protein [Macrococcus caseolyticus]MCE4955904.1 DegV family protein [Macrococcus caseolyticus]
MNKIAWVTDTASGLQIGEKDTFVVPMGVILNEKHYQDQAELSVEKFYNLLKEYGDGAKTTQPNFQAIQDTFKEIEQKGYTHVIAVHPSSKLTGSFQSSVIASQEVNITSAVIDSKIGSYPMKAMIEAGKKMNEAGKSFEEIVETIKRYAEDAVLILNPKNLNQMKKSGRVSKTQSFMAGLLNIHLVLQFEDGSIYPIDKVRTKKKVVDAIKMHVEKNIAEFKPKEICVVYGGDKAEADIYIEWLQDTFPDINIVSEILVPVAGVHLGYGTIGISWIKR